MNLFRRKKAARPPSPVATARFAFTSDSHRLTLELKRVETFAAMLANSRRSNVVEVSDYLAGMYLCNWDHLAQYWNEHDQEQVENILREVCKISPQRWHAWIELYDQQKQQTNRKGWRRFRLSRDGDSREISIQPSRDLATILRQAEKIAPAYDRTPDRSIPILTTECVLLCIVRNLSSVISRKLALSGLDIARLEREVLVPRRRPRASQT
jgi:hypothetical protein